MSGTILIVDDEPVQRRLLENAVQKLGYQTLLAESGEEALEKLNQQNLPRIMLVILDIVMPDLDGMGVLGKMRDSGMKIPVIVQTSKGGIDIVVSAMRAGAVDFIVKPLSPERLRVAVQTALKLGALEGELKRIKKSATGTLSFEDMIASSASMSRVIDLGQRAAASTIPILLEGDSGVGKEVMARAIQGSGARRSKPFVTVNCGAIPDNLVESILFGHEKGAFTGANDKHVGKFQEANGGTLFLDEVGELPLEVQVKLLRALQEGEVDPVGSSRPVKVDIRLISATNKNLIDQVKIGAFREDLYYRLNVFPIWMPALRDRADDIPALARHFLARFVIEEGRGHIGGINSSAMDLLMAYKWPGNIRQLENAVFRAVILCDNIELSMDDFPQIVAQLPDFSPHPSQDNAVSLEGLQIGKRQSDMEINPKTIDEVIPPIGNPLNGIQNLVEHHAGGNSHFALLPMLSGDGMLRSLDEVEGDLVRFAIDHHNGRMTQVAKSLGIGRSTLYRKLKELGLEPGSERNAAE
jgi:DNA-binding NtrC family response regulator